MKRFSQRSATESKSADYQSRLTVLRSAILQQSWDYWEHNSASANKPPMSHAAVPEFLFYLNPVVSGEGIPSGQRFVDWLAEKRDWDRLRQVGGVALSHPKVYQRIVESLAPKAGRPIRSGAFRALEAWGSSVLPILGAERAEAALTRVVAIALDTKADRYVRSVALGVLCAWGSSVLPILGAERSEAVATRLVAIVLDPRAQSLVRSDALGVLEAWGSAIGTALGAERSEAVVTSLFTIVVDREADWSVRYRVREILAALSVWHHSGVHTVVARSGDNVVREAFHQAEWRLFAHEGQPDSPMWIQRTVAQLCHQGHPLTPTRFPLDSYQDSIRRRAERKLAIAPTPEHLRRLAAITDADTLDGLQERIAHCRSWDDLLPPGLNIESLAARRSDPPHRRRPASNSTEGAPYNVSIRSLPSERVARSLTITVPR